MRLKRSAQLAAITLAVILSANNTLFAQTRLPNIISSNMVLQRNTRVPIWGWAAPGQQVKVEFAGQSQVATAGTDSLWQAKLSPLAASETPRSMTITAGTKQTKLDNILVGEVWLCSGQSNMEYGIERGWAAAPGKGIDSAALEIGKPHPGIRAIKVETKFDVPDIVTHGWQVGESKEFARSSAAAFYFAKQLHAKLGVPVGVITSAWGGSRLEPWAPPAAYANIPAFTEDIKQSDTLIEKETVGRMYRSMIAPMVPFAIKGFLWYQGESNCLIEEHDMRYAYKMQALVNYWRKQWNADLPFYYVLVAPYNYTDWTNMPHTPQTLPKFWEQQVAAAQIPNTGFISITDLTDNMKDVHPSYKWVVGRRLANLALSKTYKEKGLPYLYPQYDHKKAENSKLVLYFKNADGFKTIDGKSPNFFTIAGADGNYQPAEAVVKGNTVTLSNPAVKNPVEARLGWTQEANPNLINAEGLPAIPFRTNAEKWIYKAN